MQIREKEEAATETIITTWVISALEERTKCRGSSEQRAVHFSPAAGVWKAARAGEGGWLGLVGFEVGGGGQDTSCREEHVQRQG